MNHIGLVIRLAVAAPLVAVPWALAVSVYGLAMPIAWIAVALSGAVMAGILAWHRGVRTEQRVEPAPELRGVSQAA